MLGAEKGPCGPFKELKEAPFGTSVDCEGSMVRDEADEQAGALEAIFRD